MKTYQFRQCAKVSEIGEIIVIARDYISQHIINLIDDDYINGTRQNRSSEGVNIPRLPL